jgi:hypothetical protein
LEHSPALDKSGHDRLLKDDKWSGIADSWFERATRGQGAWHPGDIDRPLGDGTELCNPAAQLAHHLRRAPGPKGIDGAIGAHECDVTAILRPKSSDDRPIGISEDRIRSLVGGRMSESHVRACVDHTGYFGDVPVTGCQPMEERLELTIARAFPLNKDQDKRPGPARTRPAEDGPIVRHCRKRPDPSLGKYARLDQLSGGDIV